MPEDPPVVEEPDCEDAVEAVLDEAFAAGDDEAIEEALFLRAVAVRFLGPRGGGWGGASAPVDVAVAIGRRNGLTLTSRKRSSGSAGSDHHTGQRRSDAADLSNGSLPTPQMDRAARQIAAACGVRGWGFGVLCREAAGYRVQLLYRTNVGGNHFNHVHVGVRVGGRC